MNQADRQSPPGLSRSSASDNPPPACEWCSDTGWLTSFRDLATDQDYPVKAFDVPEFRWAHRDFVETCAECECVVEKRRAASADKQMRAIFGETGERGVYRHFTFETWDALPIHVRRGKEEARQAAGVFAADGRLEAADGAPQIGLILSGPTGTTKTGLATCILKERIARGQSCLWIEAWRLIEQIKDTYRKGSKRTYLDVIGSVSTVPLLLLDDLGPGRGMLFNEHARNLLWTVLDQRYARLLPGVITTNLDWDEFKDALGPALAYRINQIYRWQPVGGRNQRAEE